MRAVLLDAATKRMERVVDWRVDERGQYLWQAGPGRVIVHMNGGLHLLGADLKEIAVVPVDSDVLWLTSSASGKRIAVGILRERHDKKTHEQIEQLSGEEPEEDVEMRLLDDTGRILMTRNTTSKAPPPVITDDYEYIVAGVGPRRWRLVAHNVDGGNVRTLVTLESRCRPRLSAPLSKALFVTGCDAEGARWYRVLGEDGRSLLRSRPSMEEIEDSAAGGGEELAIRYVRLASASSSATDFKIRELKSEHISVRSRDGKSLLAIAEPQYPLSRESYALSTDGRRLAVLTKTNVEVFDVGAPD
ncbi:MAG TPA: hypothetical protein VGC07_03485 [Granulicella sp.]